jgi:hypothetical protein
VNINNAIVMPDIEAQKLLAQQLQIRQDAEKQLEDAMEAENGAEKNTTWCHYHYGIIWYHYSITIVSLWYYMVSLWYHYGVMNVDEC